MKGKRLLRIFIMALLAVVGAISVWVGSAPKDVAAEASGYFYLVAENENSFVIAPVQVAYSEGQTIGEALQNSGYELTGIDSGIVTAINGVEATWCVADNNGNYALGEPAESIQLWRYYTNYEQLLPSVAVRELIGVMGDYAASSVARYEMHARNAYAAAEAAYFGISDTDAVTLTQDLKKAIADAEAGLYPIAGGAQLLELKFTAGTTMAAKTHAMSPHFQPDVYEYTVTVPDTTLNFGCWATAAGKGSVITAKWTNTGGFSREQVISSGAVEGKALNLFLATGGNGNTCEIVVVNGEETKTYTIHVVRTRSLVELTLHDAQRELILSPSFGRDKYEYTSKTTENTVTVKPSAFISTQNAYRVEVNGTVVDHGKTLAVPIVGEVGDITPISIVVFCDSDHTSTTYQIMVRKVAIANVSFDLSPADASIFLLDSAGERIYPEETGVYTLIGGEAYTYTITKNGYVSSQETFTAQDGVIKVQLQKANENSGLRPDMPSAWKNFRGNDNNSGVVNFAVPTAAEDTTLYWATKYGDGWASAAPSSPIFVDRYLVFTSETNIVKMDRVTGKIVATGTMCAKSSFNITPPTYGDGMIFVALANGIMQAFNADTLESLWVYQDELLGQPNSPITYHEGYVYTGFWTGESTDANYVCLPAADEDPDKTDEKKVATWTYRQQGGFYWAGSFVCDGFLLVGTDDGATGSKSQTSVLLSLDPLTGKVLDSIDGFNGDIRSTICYDETSDRYYFTSKGGTFYRVGVNEDGTFNPKSLKSLPLGGMSTSTPVVYNGRSYVGVSGTAQFEAYSGHHIAVIDLTTWTIAYTCPTQGYPQTSGLLTTAYEADTGYAYIYFIDNYTPGKIRVIKDKPGQKKMENEDGLSYAPILFTPVDAQAQYAICSPIVDEYGTLYFKNDSAHMMALGSAVEKIAVTKLPAKTRYVEGEVFDPTGMEVTAYYKNGLTMDITDYVSYVAGYDEETNRPIYVSADELTEGFGKDEIEVNVFFTHVLYQDQDDGDAANDKNLINIEVDKPYDSVAVEVISASEMDAVDWAIYLIDNLSENPAENSREELTAAREAYDALNYWQKIRVSNYDRLTATEEAYIVYELQVQKNAAIAELQEYVDSDAYRPAQQQELAAAIAAGTAAINQAENRDAIADALAEAKTVIDTIKTDEQWKEEESGEEDIIVVDIRTMRDVKEGAWYYHDVAYVLAKGIMRGVENDLFSPEGKITRGQFVTILGRYAGIADSTNDNPTETQFSDVGANRYYAAHVAWAARQGITNGTSPTTFNAEDTITRQDMSTMMARFARAMEMPLPDGTNAAAFADDSQIAAYARDAVYSMAEAGILDGVGNHVFEPTATAARAQAAKIIHLLMEL